MEPTPSQARIRESSDALNKLAREHAHLVGEQLGMAMEAHVMIVAEGIERTGIHKGTVVILVGTDPIELCLDTSKLPQPFHLAVSSEGVSFVTEVSDTVNPEIAELGREFSESIRRGMGWEAP